METGIQTYSTADLYLASFLKLKGHRFNVDRKGGKVFFNFEKSELLNQQVIDYLNEAGDCHPLTYANSIKNMKNLIYNI